MASKFSKKSSVRNRLIVGKRGIEGTGIPVNVTRAVRAMIVISQVDNYVKRKTTAQKLGTMVQPSGWQNGNSEYDKASQKVWFTLLQTWLRTYQGRFMIVLIVIAVYLLA